MVGETIVGVGSGEIEPARGGPHISQVKPSQASWRRPLRRIIGLRLTHAAGTCPLAGPAWMRSQGSLNLFSPYGR